MFVKTLQNGLRAGHFNDSLAPKPTSNMDEVMNRPNCYIKGEESNREKRHRDIQEKPHIKQEKVSPQKERPR